MYSRKTFSFKEKQEDRAIWSIRKVQGAFTGLRHGGDAHGADSNQLGREQEAQAQCSPEPLALPGEPEQAPAPPATLLAHRSLR